MKAKKSPRNKGRRTLMLRADIQLRGVRAGPDRTPLPCVKPRKPFWPAVLRDRANRWGNRPAELVDS